MDTSPLCLGGLPILPLSIEEWANLVVSASAEALRNNHQPAYFTSANCHLLSRAARDPELRKCLLDSDGIDSDGQPLVWMSRLLKRPIAERTATYELFEAIARRADREKLSFYFLGAEEDVSKAAVDAVRQKYPGIKIAGRRNGYFAVNEEAQIASGIAASRPDMLWVGLGAPLEHRFVARNRASLTGVGAIRTCGGLFDFLSGRKKRAPVWMQKAGLEWLFRLSLEPKRLFWRYALTNPHAIYLLLTTSRDTWIPKANG